MSPTRVTPNRGFSLMEMLAVILIMAVLASTAIALYGNTRKGGAARACKANIASIQSAEDSRALRTQAYATLADLVGGSEGLHNIPTCPLDGATYSLVQFGTATAIATGYADKIEIKCPNGGAHATDTGVASSNWVSAMGKATPESLP